MVSDHLITTLSKNVCVIGAGPSGLVAARELRKEGHKVVVMEQKHDVGGQWLYEPNVAREDPLGRSKDNFLQVHSSVYASLRVDSPREIMGFSDFPFLVKKGRDMRRYPGYKELWLYIKDFCAHFGLREMIRFNTRVEYVGFEGIGKDLKWVVKSRGASGGGEAAAVVVEEEVFDAVVVAIGHYAHPRLPTIKGMDSWGRKQIHSHIYRTPEPFHNEVVVVVGNSKSGQDISIELLGVAKEVHLSAKSLDITQGLSKIISKHHNLHLRPQNNSIEPVEVAKEVHLSAKSLNITQGLSKIIAKHQNLHLRPQIDFLQEDGRVVFIDGSWVIADTILYCTGYSYAYPFLDTKGIVGVDDNRVGPLYEHTFPPALAPSLSFIGIPTRVIAFPFFESQAKWVAQLLSGKRTLPPFDDMMQSIKEFYNYRDTAGIPKHKTHSIGRIDPHDLTGFEYCNKYRDHVGFPHLEEWRKQLCATAIFHSFNNLETFRDCWDDDHELLLQEALQTPYFTQLGLQDYKVDCEANSAGVDPVNKLDTVESTIADRRLCN